MRTIYAAQFAVGPREGESPVAAWDRLKGMVCSWIQECYRRWYELPCDPPIQGGTQFPAEGHELKIELSPDKFDDISLWTANWIHPSQSDSIMQWHSRCELARRGDRIELVFSLRIGAREFVVIPPNFAIRRPQLIRSALEGFACTLGNRPISPRPVRIESGTMDRWVDESLYSRDRRLPIVLISREPRSGRYLADPAEVANQVMGLAEIWTLDDPRDSLTLSARIGRMASCYNGAARIYWPGFGRAEGSHVPVYLPEVLTQMEDDGETLGEQLLERLSGIAALRSSSGPLVQEVRDELAVREANDRETLRNEAKGRGDLGELLRLADTENARLKLRYAGLAQWNEDLREEIQTLRARLDQVETQDEPPPPPPVETEPDTVAAAVLKAEQEFSDTLVFLPEAHRSAEVSPFAQPKRVMQALAALDQVCRMKREADEAGRSIGPLEQVFRRLGVVYKANVPVSARGGWADEAMATYEGRSIPLEQHLVLGRGGPINCLRIHFFLDDEQPRVVIGHVGKPKKDGDG